MKKHDWQSLNRAMHRPEHLGLEDLFNELQCVITDGDVQTLAFMLDERQYKRFGTKIGTCLSRAHLPPAANKVAPRKPKRSKA